MSAPNARPWLPITLLAAMLSGCDPTARDGLVVGTSWPAEDRARIAREFGDWLASSGRGPVPIAWLVVDPGDDLSGLAGRRDRPDLLLGAPARDLDRLARSERLSPFTITGSPAWAVAREGSIGTGDGHTFNDPRRDPISLARAEGQLEGRFAEGYARLVRDAGGPHRIGRRARAAMAADGRGQDRGTQGVAILAGSKHPEEAGLFAEFLAETGNLRPASPAPDRRSDAARGLLADLLGSTLVDSQDELRTAWDALEGAGSPEAQLRALTEPPPWPPASIARILDREGGPAMAMIEALAGQIATDPASRTWLVSSWLSPRRPIDLSVLDELARANDGRLEREPRFRDWLRAEWTAWARQRYRRVARAIGEPRGPAAVSTH